MRKKEMFSIYDAVAMVFSQFPFPAANQADATRAFAQAINSPDSDFGKNPLDYVLYSIGEYDMIDGKVTGWETGPKKVCSGVDVFRKEESE